MKDLCSKSEKNSGGEKRSICKAAAAMGLALILTVAVISGCAPKARLSPDGGEINDIETVTGSGDPTAAAPEDNTPAVGGEDDVLTDVPYPDGIEFVLADGKFKKITEVMDVIIEGNNRSASADLCGEGEVQIAWDGGYEEWESGTLSVGGLSVSNVSIIKLGIIDLDVTDKYRELAVFWGGGDETTDLTLYRYTGDEIIELGTCWSYSDNYWANGLGTVIEEEQYTWLSDPFVALMHYEIEGNTMTEVRGDPTAAYGREYGFSDEAKRIGIYFAETNNTDFGEVALEVLFRPEEHRYEFSENEKFTLLGLGTHSQEDYDSYVPNHGAWYRVELKDGRRGAFYHQLAG